MSTTRSRFFSLGLGLVLLGMVVPSGSGTTAPMTMPLPPGEGELPRFSSLLWNHVGKNRALGQKTVTVNLTANRRPGPHGSMRIGLGMHTLHP